MVSIYWKLELKEKLSDKAAQCQTKSLAMEKLKMKTDLSLSNTDS